MKKYNTVEEYISEHQNWTYELEALRSIMLQSEMIETVKEGVPVYTLNSKSVTGLGVFKTYVVIWFFNGVFLDDEEKKLQNAHEGETNALRQWCFSSKREISKDEEIIKNYVKEAIVNQKAGKELKREKSNEKITMPEELQEALAKNSDFKKAFDSLSPSKQKECIAYIGSAKKPAIRVSRLTKITPMIYDGIGLNDNYKNV